MCINDNIYMHTHIPVNINHEYKYLYMRIYTYTYGFERKIPSLFHSFFEIVLDPAEYLRNFCLYH
jgi:hypothetical protein